MYPCWSLTAPMMVSTRGQPWERVSPDPCRTCNTHSSCRCLTSPWGTDDSSDSGPSSSVCNFYAKGNKNNLHYCHIYKKYCLVSDTNTLYTIRYIHTHCKYSSFHQRQAIVPQFNKVHEKNGLVAIDFKWHLFCLEWMEKWFFYSFCLVIRRHFMRWNFESKKHKYFAKWVMWLKVFMKRYDV